MRKLRTPVTGSVANLSSGANMTDISKCPGETAEAVCPYRETCRRFTAPSGELMPAPLYQLSEGGEWKCDEYWRVET